MADEPLSSLPVVATPAATDYVPILDGPSGGPYVTSRATISALVTAGGGGGGGGGGTLASLTDIDQTTAGTGKVLTDQTSGGKTFSFQTPSGGGGGGGGGSTASPPLLVQTAGVNVTGGTYTATLPTGATAGNLLIAVSSSSNAGTATLPSGFTLYQNVGDPTLIVAYKVATGGETTFTLTNTNTTSGSLRIFEYSNASAPSQWAHSTQGSAAANTPSITPAAKNCVVMAAWDINGVTPGTQAGWTAYASYGTSYFGLQVQTITQTTAIAVAGQATNANDWGAIFVIAPAGTTLLEGLSDVNIASKSDGQVLTWSAVDGFWEAKTPGGGAGATVSPPNLVQTASDGDPNAASHVYPFFNSTVAGNICLLLVTHSGGLVSTAANGYALLYSQTGNGQMSELWGKIATGGATADSPSIAFASGTGLHNTLSIELSNAVLPTSFIGAACGPYTWQVGEIAAPAGSIVFGLFSLPTSNGNGVDGVAPLSGGGSYISTPETSVTTSQIVLSPTTASPTIFCGSNSGCGLAFVVSGATPYSGGPVNPPTYDATVLAQTPTHYWPLNDAVGATSAADVIGAAALAVEGSPVFGYPPLAADSETSCYFPGASGSYLQMAAGAQPSGSFSLSLILQPGNTTQDNQFVSFSLTGVSGTFAGKITQNGSAPATWAWTAAQIANHPSLATASPNKTHIVYTYNGSHVTVYVNGTPVVSTAASVTASVTAGAFGSDPSNGTTSMSGRIGKIALWNGVVLTQAQINAQVAAAGL
jgi:hypothetical protein